MGVSQACHKSLRGIELSSSEKHKSRILYTNLLEYTSRQVKGDVEYRSRALRKQKQVEEEIDHRNRR